MYCVYVNVMVFRERWIDVRVTSNGVSQIRIYLSREVEKIKPSPKSTFERQTGEYVGVSLEEWLPDLVGFFYFEFSFPLDDFSLIWKHHHFQWRAANLDLYSAVMAIEQRGFFSVHTVPHLLWHWASFIIVFRWSVTIRPVLERFAMNLPLPVFIT